MNRLLKVRGSLRGVLGVAGALLTLSALLVTDASAKVYIDITSPAFKRLPIGISDLAGPKGQEIAEILRDDLDFTGLFMCLDNKAFVETPSQLIAFSRTITRARDRVDVEPDPAALIYRDGEARSVAIIAIHI